MAETFRHALQIVCLDALAVAVAALALVALRRETAFAAARLSAFWRSLTGPGRMAALSLALVCVLYGGGKTNLPQRVLAPLAAIVQRTELVQRAGADFFAANWNRRGAWRDSLRFDFADGWVFPWGSNHLAGVEVMSWGEVRTARGNTNAVATVGVPLAIVPGLTTFAYELTPSNSYRFAWTDAAANRDTNTLVTAAIELLRCGDVVVTTNGVAARTVRTLPFDHDGYGQDAEWVAANFTNAMEILQTGYAAWVESVVGTTENGLYRFTVSVSNTPPEVVNLTVGEVSVAVAEAGDYHFVLEKCTRYPIRFSWLPDGVAYSWSDGVEAANAPRLLRGAVNNPAYSVRLTSTGDNRGMEFEEPTTLDDGSIAYYPVLFVYPKEELDPAFPATLFVMVTGLPDGAYPSVTWTANGRILGTGEYFYWHGEEDVDAIGVTATCRGLELHGAVFIERHVRASSIDLLGGGLVVVEDAYTNAPGEVVAATSTSAGLALSWSLAEPGTLRLESSAAVRVTNEYGTAFTLPLSWRGGADEEDDWRLSFSCADTSQTGHIGDFTFTFTPDGSGAATLTRTVGIDVVKVRVEADADWPSNKVRHVFGPKETFKITSSPQVSLSVEVGCPAHINGNSVTAPHVPGVFSVTAAVGGTSVALPFVCIEPTGLEAIDCWSATTNDWVQHDMTAPTNGEVAVGMITECRLLPDHVSFSRLHIQEGACQATEVWGIYTRPQTVLLPHDAVAGAWADVSVGVGNIASHDFAATNLGPFPVNPESGGFRYNITNYWYITAGGVSGEKHPFHIEPQIFVFSPNGDLSVEKFGVVATRGTNDVTTITRSP